MMLEELIAGLGTRIVGGAATGVRVCDLTEDSRTVVPGSLFIARGGTKADGKRFLADALAAGAVAMLTDDEALRCPEGFDCPVVFSTDVGAVCGQMAERFYGSPAARLKLVGVTGTNGKTTTTYLTWQLLNGAGTRCGLIGTVVIDDGMEVAAAHMTTPPAIEISRTLGMMVEGGCAAAALEVSSHALDQKRADALPFAVAVFTNLTGDHLDYHGTMEQYAAAKRRLFTRLSPDGCAVINSQDPWAERMVAGTPGRVLRCGVRSASTIGGPASALDCTVQALEESIHGMLLRLDGPWGSVQAMVPLVGRYNAMNVLQAVASCHAVGMTAAELSRGLPSLAAPPGRLERVTTPGDPFSVFVDYAHSDDSLASVLTAVGAVMEGRSGATGAVTAAAGSAAPRPSGGRLWVVFGCGGERDRTKRPRMGRVAAQHADVVIITNDNPRSERPGDIVDEILSGIAVEHKGKVTVEVDRARAIQMAVEGAQPGDVIVIAGKGHETEQLLPDGKGGSVRMHFDDREVARAALAQVLPGHRGPSMANAEVKSRRGRSASAGGRTGRARVGSGLKRSDRHGR